MKRTTPSSSVLDRIAALGEPIRLRLLRVLEREELSVGELAKIIQLPQSTVSRHLKVLADGDWIAKRAAGTATLYRLVLDDLGAEHRSLWLPVRDQMQHGAELSEDMRRLAGVVADRREDSKTFFGRVAGQWDSVRDELFGRAFTPMGLLALLPSTWEVADLGCGTGNVAELLSPLVRRVVAVDSSEPMLTAARQRLASLGASNVTFVHGGLEELPLESASVDAAVSVLVLHHVERPELALREMRRVLRSGGTALVIDMTQHDRESYRRTMGHRWLGFSDQELESLFREAGFEQPRVVHIPPSSDAAGPGLIACTGRAT